MAKRSPASGSADEALPPKLFVMMAAIALVTFGTLVGSYELLFPGTSAAFVA